MRRNVFAVVGTTLILASIALPALAQSEPSVTGKNITGYNENPIAGGIAPGDSSFRLFGAGVWGFVARSGIDYARRAVEIERTDDQVILVFCETKVRRRIQVVTNDAGIEAAEAAPGTDTFVTKSGRGARGFSGPTYARPDGTKASCDDDVRNELAIYDQRWSMERYTFDAAVAEAAAAKAQVKAATTLTDASVAAAKQAALELTKAKGRVYPADPNANATNVVAFLRAPVDDPPRFFTKGGGGWFYGPTRAAPNQAPRAATWTEIERTNTTLTFMVCETGRRIRYDFATRSTSYLEPGTDQFVVKSPPLGEPQSGTLDPAQPKKNCGAVRNVESGPIWDQENAKKVCAVVAAEVGGEWTGNWHTTQQGVMSVCEMRWKK